MLFFLGAVFPGAGPGESQGWVSFAGAPSGAAPGDGRHVVLVAGDEEYRSEETLPQLARILSEHHGFRCTVLFSQTDGVIDPDNRGNIPGLELVADADLLILFLRFRRLPDGDMAHIVKHVEAGKPLIGIRTATHAFSYEDQSQSPYAAWSWKNAEWPGGFGRQILGETWVRHHGHHGHESTLGVAPKESRSHPILRGVGEVWGPTDVYGIRNLPEDATVVLEGSVRAGMTADAQAVGGPKNQPRMPVLWTRERALAGEAGEQDTQRIVCSTLGASVDFASAGLRRALVNSCYWALELEDKIDPARSVDLVGEFKPTMFGFGGFVRGVRPAEHAWPRPLAKD
ncbi:MAG: hypothetical protein CMJ87_08850 [Planctomycetes bacterium]|jgi:hypothetical protein|nr:hypothetical protein [Planctomycetota bacterium]